MLVVVLADGKTFSPIHGCKVMQVPDDVDADEIEIVLNDMRRLRQRSLRTGDGIYKTVGAIQGDRHTASIGYTEHFRPTNPGHTEHGFDVT